MRTNRRIALLALLLLLGAGIFLLGSMGGGEEGATEPSTPSSSEVAPGPGTEGEAGAPAGLSSALAMVSQAVGAARSFLIRRLPGSTRRRYLLQGGTTLLLRA